MIYIGDVPISWSSTIPTVRSSSVTEHPIDSKDRDNVTTHIRKSLPEWSINCILEGDNKVEYFNRLDQFWKDDELLTISAEHKWYENLVITKIKEDTTTLDTIKFTMTFKEVQFTSVKYVSVPSSELAGIAYAMRDEGRINKDAEVFEEGFRAADTSRVRVYSGVAGEVIGDE